MLKVSLDVVTTYSSNEHKRRAMYLNFVGFFVLISSPLLAYSQDGAPGDDTQELIGMRMVARPCSTPDDKDGYCVPIKNCSTLLEMLGDQSKETFLQDSKCNIKQSYSNPIVCCPKGKKSQKQCGRQNVSVASRIFGGTKAAPGEFPWLVRLIHRNSNGNKLFGCTGFLIAPGFVLTAAHCLKSDNIDLLGPIYEVELGVHNCKKGVCLSTPFTIKVEASIVHPGYSTTSRHHHHDIGLIQMSKGTNSTPYISPICYIPDSDFEPFEYWISGWGSTESERISEFKMKVSIPPYDHANCTQNYQRMNVEVTDKQICAGGQHMKDSCTGDSGGPLMYVKDKNHWFAAGVVSYGSGCGREGWPGVYTKISSYAQWISETMSIRRQKIKERKRG